MSYRITLLPGDGIGPEVTEAKLIRTAEMIQRIQTVFLFLGAVCSGLTILFDEVRGGAAATESAWFTPVVTGLFGLTVAGALMAIFLYRNRQRQRSAVLVLQYVALSGIVSLVVGQVLSGTLPFQATDSGGQTDLLIYALPAAAYILFFLARRGIDRDINLIRSQDRLR